MKIRNLDKILDKIGDFGRTKNDILDNIFSCVPIDDAPELDTNWLLEGR